MTLNDPEGTSTQYGNFMIFLQGDPNQILLIQMACKNWCKVKFGIKLFSANIWNNFLVSRGILMEF